MGSENQRLPKCVPVVYVAVIKKKTRFFRNTFQGFFQCTHNSRVFISVAPEKINSTYLFYYYYYYYYYLGSSNRLNGLFALGSLTLR